ncbi:MAG: O-antigen ligase family protein [Limisphaerales bacterium]
MDRVKAILKSGGCAALLFFTVGVALFGEALAGGSGLAWLRSLALEVRAVCRDPGTQWMVFLCAGIYFVTFTLLGERGVRSAERGTGASTPHPRREKSKMVRRTSSGLRPPSPQSGEGQLSPVGAERETGLGRGASGNLQRATFNLEPADWFLCGLLLIAALHYAFNYATASGSTQALMLIVGAAMGKGARLWASRRVSTTKHTKGGTDNLQPATFNLQLLLATLLLLVAAAALWHPEAAMQFQYRGLNRWSGPWDNPNIFGLLMGVGVVLAAGLLVASGRSQAEATPHPDPLPGRGGEGIVHQRLLAWISGFFCLGALLLCAVGLLNSYSRGAWLGTVLGLAVLGYQASRFQVLRFQVSSACRSCVSWLRRNWMPCSILLAAILVLCFWQFRYTEFHPVRRAFSVGNKNDFSWRNRVAAWEGALAMMADKPLVGFGWNKPERIYDQFYRPPKVSEGMAIQLNHYFILGMSLGLPALICFLAYIGFALSQGGARHSVRAATGAYDGGAQGTDAPHLELSLTRHVAQAALPAGSGSSPAPSPTAVLGAITGQGCPANPQARLPALRPVCHAAAVVLLVGLWFDGGLFNLATASVFWVLLELGRGTALPACRGQDEKASNEKPDHDQT